MVISFCVALSGPQCKPLSTRRLMVSDSSACIQLLFRVIELEKVLLVSPMNRFDRQHMFTYSSSPMMADLRSAGASFAPALFFASAPAGG